jgi:hypothetical protein
MTNLIYKTVEVPLSKLHFEIYNNEGNKIEMGDGSKTRSNCFQARTDDISPLMVRSVEFPKFDYANGSRDEPMAKLNLCYEEGVDYNHFLDFLNVTTKTIK